MQGPSVKKIEALKTDFNDITVYTFPMKVKDAITIDYVAVGGRENGAGRRVLNQERIESIKDFVLRGHTLLAWVVLDLLPSAGRLARHITTPNPPRRKRTGLGLERIASPRPFRESKKIIIPNRLVGEFGTD